jgi:tRNA(fMet)-specific endonuclease VapC
MKLCLDTNIFIEVFRGVRPHFRHRLLEVQAAGHEVHLSALVLHELTFGARLCAQPERELAYVDGAVEQSTVEPWTPEDAISAAGIRAELSARGDRIGALDSLLAGQALNRGWTLVTNNLREFIRVDGLALLDWSDPSGPRSMDRDGWSLAGLRRLPKEDK